MFLLLLEITRSGFIWILVSMTLLFFNLSFGRKSIHVNFRKCLPGFVKSPVPSEKQMTTFYAKQLTPLWSHFLLLFLESFLMIIDFDFKKMTKAIVK